jgi:hypothetical protein
MWLWPTGVENMFVIWVVPLWLGLLILFMDAWGSQPKPSKEQLERAAVEKAAFDANGWNHLWVTLWSLGIIFGGCWLGSLIFG